jgi:hypothetical protein
MLLTVDELNQIHALLQEYPDATDVSVYSDYNESSLMLVVEFTMGDELLGTVWIGDKE